MLKQNTFLANIFILLNVAGFLWDSPEHQSSANHKTPHLHYISLHHGFITRFWWRHSSNHVTQSSSLITDHIPYQQLKSYGHPELNNASLFTHFRNNTTTTFLDVSLCKIACLWMCYRQAYFGRSLKLMQHIRNSRREQRPQTTHTHTCRAFVFHYLAYREPSVQINEEKSACLSIFLTCKPAKTHSNAWIS